MILLVYCLATVIIESFFLFLCGYRKKEQLIIVVCANVLTNLTLNLILLFFGRTALLLAFLELAAVAAEYLIYAILFGRSKHLTLLTVAANILSFAIGLIIFG